MLPGIEGENPPVLTREARYAIDEHPACSFLYCLETKRGDLQRSLDNLSPADLKRAEAIASNLDAAAAIEAKRSASQALETSVQAKEDLGRLRKQVEEAVRLLQTLTGRVGQIEGQMGTAGQRTDATLSPVQ